MPKAIWKNTILAETESFESVENNTYFPPSSIKEEHFKKSDTTTFCPWKGTAHYYHVVVGDEINQDAAWYYPDPKEAAKEIKDHIAFWKGIEVK